MARAQDRVHYVNGSPFGENWNTLEYTEATKTAIEDAVDDPTNNVTAVVSIGLGNGTGVGNEAPDYVKVKFYRNSKPLAIYKSKNWDQADAIAFRNEVLTSLGLTPPV